MSNQFKPGDLALIVGAFSATENIGRSVELVEFVEPGESTFYQDGYFDGDETGVWIVIAEELVRNTVEGKVSSSYAAIAQQHLRPLRGDFQPEQQKSREVAHG